MTPVLVDTSVWRRYFAGDERVRALGELLDERGTVVTHPWVIAELVLGGLSRQEAVLLGRLPTTTLVPHEETMEFIHRRKLSRRGIGWVDVNLLASALVSSAKLWTLDASLAAAATSLRVSFVATG